MIFFSKRTRGCGVTCKNKAQNDPQMPLSKKLFKVQTTIHKCFLFQFFFKCLYDVQCMSQVHSNSQPASSPNLVHGNGSDHESYCGSWMGGCNPPPPQGSARIVDWRFRIAPPPLPSPFEAAMLQGGRQCTIIRPSSCEKISLHQIGRIKSKPHCTPFAEDDDDRALWRVKAPSTWWYIPLATSTTVLSGLDFCAKCDFCVKGWVRGICMWRILWFWCFLMI